MDQTNATAALDRESARQRNGRFGTQEFGRADRVDLVDAAEPEQNPVLRAATQRTSPLGHPHWDLTPEQATAYAESVDDEAARHVARVASQDFLVFRRGDLSGAIPGEGDGEQIVVEAGDDGALRILGDDSTTPELDHAEAAGIVVHDITIHPDGAARYDYTALVPNGRDEDSVEHEMTAVSALHRVDDVSPDGIRAFLAAEFSPTGTDELMTQARDDLDERSVDPHEAARDAYLRGIDARP